MTNNRELDMLRLAKEIIPKVEYVNNNCESTVCPDCGAEQYTGKHFYNCKIARFLELAQEKDNE